MNFKNKFMDRMFKEVEDVVVDITTNTIGIKRDGSIYTVDKDDDGDYCLSENVLGDMSVNIPAFAQATTLDKVTEGDLVLNAKGEIQGWVVKKMPKSLKILKTTGQVTNVSPSKAQLFGQGQTIMVVSSMMGEGLQDNLPMLMAMSDDDSSLKKMIPMLLMNQSGQSGGMDPMMMAMMMKDDGDSDDMMKMMMLSQMSQGGQQGGMNPLMMMAFLK